LSTDPGKNEKTGESERWENATFQTLPTVAVIAMLSEFQVNVRNAETEVLNYLYTQIDASSFKFNKLTAIVIPNSNYVTLGSDFEAQVFISATDSTLLPEITVGDNKIPIDETGIGIYKTRASSIGPKKWGGIIALKAPDGSIKNYEFKSEYVVGEPNVIVSPTAVNIMYATILNPIDVSVPGVSPDKISIKVVNGTVTTEKVKNPQGVNFKGSWAVKPDAVGKNVQVIVTANINGKPIQYAPYEFRVKAVPLPIAIFGGKSTGNISRATAIAQMGVFASLPDFDFPVQYEITGFTYLYNDKGNSYEQASTSNNLTSQQKDLISKVTRGKDLIFKDIKAKGPDGKIKDLLPIILRVE
jgi:gliding motility-associated protein GldM